jgi:NiFe hydrogenase small subunit HydA
MKYCTFLTATMGLSASYVPKVAEVFAAPKQRPPVIWLHFGECTGCSEAMLRTMYPYVDELVLEILSVEYHETIMAAAGHQAEEKPAAAGEKVQGQIHLRGGRAQSPPNTTAAMVRSAGGPFWKSPRKWFPRPKPPSHTEAVPASAAFRRPNPTRADTKAWAMHWASRP